MRPNIVIIVSDDQGYGDLGCLGADHLATPHLDALAASGALLETFYSNSPVCSPSRASILTGRYPGNAGVRSIVEHHRWAPGLSNDVPTLPSILRDEGYSTAMVGKWHLGQAAGCLPGDHGFQEYFGPLSGTVDYFSHINYQMSNRPMRIAGKPVQGTAVHDLWEDRGEIWRNGEYLTEMIGQRAVDVIERRAADDRPFFLAVTFTAPHFPMHAPAKYLDRFPDLGPEQRIVAAMISAMDDQVGEIIAALQRTGVRDDTLVWFLSDNGPSREIRNWLDGRQDPFYGSSSGGLRGHKFSLFEGGVRVPSMVSWPGRIPAGRAVTEPIAAMDILPTVAAAAGVDLGRVGPVDGADAMDHLRADPADDLAPLHDVLCWEQGPQTAIRRGAWKLVLNGQVVEHEGPLAEVWLSDLAADPSETKNLAADRPDVVSELTEIVMTWRDRIEQVWTSVWLPRLGTETSFDRPSFMR